MWHTWIFPSGLERCISSFLLLIRPFFPNPAVGHSFWSGTQLRTVCRYGFWLCGDPDMKNALSLMVKCEVWNLLGRLVCDDIGAPGGTRHAQHSLIYTMMDFVIWPFASCCIMGRNRRGDRVDKKVKQQRNKLSLWQLLTITDWQVIWLTSVLVDCGHGAVSWD